MAEQTSVQCRQWPLGGAAEVQLYIPTSLSMDLRTINSVSLGFTSFFSFSNFNNTHQTLAGGPVNLVVNADARLAGLQRVWETADLQHQEVHGVEDFLAVHHTVSQALQLAVANGS